MRNSIFILNSIFFLFLALSSCKSDNQITNFKYPSEAPLFEPVFVDFDINNSSQNFADAKQIQVDLEITTPNADKLTLPCFYLQDKENPNKWQARFLPRQTGNYKFVAKVTSNQSIAYSNEYTFSSTKAIASSSSKGLLSLDKDDYFYMKYDNGDKFKGLGLNVGWVFEPKWNNPDIYSFEGFFKEMNTYGANYIRMWICPWNLPIEWTPVPEYNMVFEDFNDLSKAYAHSDGFEISSGTAKECQSDEGQLIKSSSTDEYIIYEVDAPKLFKLMIYNRGELSLSDFDLSVSEDSKTFTPVETNFSESWNSYNEWQRIFLYSYNLGDKNTKYVKLTLKNSLKNQDVKLAGIQLRHGEPNAVLDCNGLNNYSKNNSEALDDLLKLADEYGIKILLTLGYHGQFKPVMDSWGANDEWQRNPYNKENGGPCETPSDFFTNSEAKAAYTNYLRYFVARWGYSDVVAGWELWNEIDIIMRKENLPEDDLVAWHAEMSKFLKEVDPYNHPVTTSFSHGNSDALWNIETIDITHTHHYSPSLDFASYSKMMLEKYNKPHLIGEYAVDWKGPGFGYTDADYEEEFHDGMWRGLFTESPVLPLSWWWEYHLDNDQYKYFKPLRIAIDRLKDIEGKLSVLDIEQQSGYQILGVGSTDTKLVWIKDIDKTKPNNVINIKLNGNESFKVVHMNTYTGKITELKDAKLNSGTLSIDGKYLSPNGDALIILNPMEN